MPCMLIRKWRSLEVVRERLVMGPTSMSSPLVIALCQDAFVDGRRCKRMIPFAATTEMM